MIRTIISDIGNVLSGFAWYDFYKSKGYSEEMVERLAKATVGSDVWKEYDRGVLSEEEILYLILHINRLCAREDCDR